MLLGVNIDHVATLRQTRGTSYPSPIEAASIAEKAGANSITVHLREDRRHIQDLDVYELKENLILPLNLEMAVTKEMLILAKKIKPKFCCLVPEKRMELTTEGGLDVIAQKSKIQDSVEMLKENGVRASLFIDPNEEQIIAASEILAPCIEIHTGNYADTHDNNTKKKELENIKKSINLASSLDLKVNAGHGLNYENVKEIAAISEIQELNIGHSIISRAVIVGLSAAIKEMKALIDNPVINIANI